MPLYHILGSLSSHVVSFLCSWYSYNYSLCPPRKLESNKPIITLAISTIMIWLALRTFHIPYKPCTPYMLNTVPVTFISPWLATYKSSPEVNAVASEVDCKIMTPTNPTISKAMQASPHPV